MPIIVNVPPGAYELVDGLALEREGSAIPSSGWRQQQLLFRAATRWFEHARNPVGGIIVFASPNPAHSPSPEFSRLSNLIDAGSDFAFTGNEAVRALAGFLADDQLRGDFFPEGEAPEHPIHVEFDLGPMPTAAPGIRRAEETVVLMRITAPQHLPEQHWSDDMDPGEPDASTAFTYAQMFDAIKHCFT